jgi:hypothetical protein
MKKSGGGITSKNNVSNTTRTGSGSKSIRPGWVGQRGIAQGDHSTDNRKSSGYRGTPKFDGNNFQPVKFGNELALNVGKGGPGVGYKTYACGSQQGLKPAVPQTSSDWSQSYPPSKKI